MYKDTFKGKFDIILLLPLGEIKMPKASDQVKISIKKPDGTVITIDLPQERAMADILHVIKGVIGVSDGNEVIKPDTNSSSGSLESRNPMVDGLDELSIMEKIKILIKNATPLLWFSSHDIQELYQHYFGKVAPSTVSTYLARLVKNGNLERQGSRVNRRYKLVDNSLVNVTSIDLSEISIISHIE